MDVRQLESREDARGIIRTHGRAWREAYDGLLPDPVLDEQTIRPTDEEVSEWYQELRENREGVLVALDGENEVRGFADFRWGDSDTKEFVAEGEAGLKAIYVDPSYWNQGIGSALLDRGLDILPDSVEAVRLEVFSENDIGRRFYEKQGFVETETGAYEIEGDTYSTSIMTYHL